MKTIAIIASCDTKGKEVAFMRECLGRAGFASLVIDTSIGPDAPDCADISREDVVAAAGVDWNDVRDKPKNELVELVTAAVGAVAAKLYAEKRFDGVIAAGGVQNSIMAAGAMQTLPIGFPTVIASVMASGNRTFGSLVGDKDIAVIPSICDFTGINPMTRTILANTCAAVCGMVEHAGKPVAKGDKPVVGFTLLGVTTKGAVAASEELERHGVETIGFHASGTGGRVMEQMAEADKALLEAILDHVGGNVRVEHIDGNIDDAAWGVKAAHAVLDELKMRGVLI